MNGEDNEIKITIEILGGRITQGGVIKAYRYKERVDQRGTIWKITEVYKGVNSCGHSGEVGGVCQECGATICSSCVKANKGYVCSICGQVCCFIHSTQSILNSDIRYCRRCGFLGVIRKMLKERNE
jgi:hypothetical protein